MDCWELQICHITVSNRACLGSLQTIFTKSLTPLDTRQRGVTNATTRVKFLLWIYWGMIVLCLSSIPGGSKGANTVGHHNPPHAASHPLFCISEEVSATSRGGPERCKWCPVPLTFGGISCHCNDTAAWDDSSEHQRSRVAHCKQHLVPPMFRGISSCCKVAEAQDYSSKYWRNWPGTTCSITELSSFTTQQVVWDSSGHLRYWAAL